LQTQQENSKAISAKIHFPKDTGYLQTAHMLVESGYLLLGRGSSDAGGVITPAAAFGSKLLPAIQKELGVTCEITVE